MLTMRVSLVLAVVVFLVTLSSIEARNRRRSHNHVAGHKHHKRTLAKRQAAFQNTVAQCITDARKAANVCIGHPAYNTKTEQWTKTLAETGSLGTGVDLNLQMLSSSGWQEAPTEADMSTKVCDKIKTGSLNGYATKEMFGDFGLGFATKGNMAVALVTFGFKTESTSTSCAPPAGTGTDSATAPTGPVVTTTSTTTMNGCRQAALKRHNELRAKHGAGPLVLDDTLNAIAQLNVETAALTKKMAHTSKAGLKTPDGQAGENAFEAMQSWAATDAELIQYATKAVDKWYSENPDYDPATCSSKNGKDVGHFTAVVWKASTKVGIGCAVTADKNWIYVTGDYLPGGNVEYEGDKCRFYNTNVVV